MLLKLNGKAFLKELNHGIGNHEWTIFRLGVVDEIVDLKFDKGNGTTVKLKL